MKANLYAEPLARIEKSLDTLHGKLDTLLTLQRIESKLDRVLVCAVDTNDEVKMIGQNTEEVTQ